MIQLSQKGPEISRFGSVDPAPPLIQGEVGIWRKVLLDEDEKLFARMRVIFSLRNESSTAAIKALCDGFQANSALLRHELAYVLGQTQSPAAVDTLIERLADESEHVMVRHEAAEALGAIGAKRAMPVLELFLNDENPEVSESCEVAIDLLNLCNSGEELEW